MSKFLLMLSIFVMAFSAHAFAQEDFACEEGQVFDEELQMCVETPTEESFDESGEGE